MLGVSMTWSDILTSVYSFTTLPVVQPVLAGAVALGVLWFLIRHLGRLGGL